MKNKRIRRQKRLMLVSRLLFIVYIFATLYFTVLSESFGRFTTSEYRYNLEPFKEIKRFYGMIGGEMNIRAYLNLFGNVICFIPFGVFLPTLFRNMKNTARVIIVTFLFSLTIETAQLYLKIGIFDVDDLILNTIGGLCGYILYFIYTRIIRRGYKK